MSKVTQDVWHHTHEEWHYSADSCGCAVKWYCLWLSPLASYVCLDLSGIAQKISAQSGQSWTMSSNLFLSPFVQLRLQ